MAALELATQFKTALKARRAALLKQDQDTSLPPGTSVDPEPAVMFPLISVQQPAAGPMAKHQPVAGSFQKRVGKRWVKARQSMLPAV